MTPNQFVSKKNFFLLFLVFLYASFSFSQNEYAWWYTKHNWPTSKTWLTALKIAPRYMGPNALPVPEINSGILPDKAYLKTGLEAHTSTGDKTQNAYAEVYIPLFSKRVGLNVNIVPYEHFKTDSITRDYRFAREYDVEGNAIGDVYIGTHIQLLAYDGVWPDIAMSINIKTASGTNLNAMRFTDTPGYYLDLSFGKNFHSDGFIKTIRPYGMLGFYAFQTYHVIYRQNDCMLYGGGLNIATKNLQLSNSFGGYKGYIGNGDNPAVYRATLTTKFNSHVNFDLRFQKGIADYKYTSLRLCCLIDL